MNEREFDDWVTVHVRATGPDNPSRLTEILIANRELFRMSWHATREELGECTARLLERGNVPPHANEHTNAIYIELKAMRKERTERAAAKQYGQGHGILCGCIGCAEARGEADAIEARERLKAWIAGTGGK